MHTFKIERMQQILIEEINFLILSGAIKDPRLSKQVSVVRAKLSKDLSSCVVYISALLNMNAIERNAEILNHARGFIQYNIAKKHQWKYTPKLTFKASDSLSKGNSVLEKIQKLSEPN